MKLGCDTVMFNQLDLYGALQHISWAGYEGTEICFQELLCQHIELNTNQSYIDEVKYIARKHGQELFAILTGWGPGFDTLSDKDKVKLLTKVFDVAVKLNIPIITIRTYGKSDDLEATKQQFKYIRELCERAESRGIILAVKPHINASVYNIQTTIQMLNEINSSALGINLDLLQAYKSGDDLSEFILKLGNRIVHTNFQDGLKVFQFSHLNSKGSRETGEEQIPGRSDINFPKILKCLKGVGYDKAIIVQVTCNLPVPLPGQIPYPLSRQMGIAAEARGYLNRCLQELK